MLHSHNHDEPCDIILRYIFLVAHFHIAVLLELRLASLPFSNLGHATSEGMLLTLLSRFRCTNMLALWWLLANEQR
ncbi:hypothetical protein F5B20DRAFT_527199 [Whalleya microplaca]|nr:hypothetical protein F5B20DRAFT_527199 [Whalleya microplaca]